MRHSHVNPFTASTCACVALLLPIAGCGGFRAKSIEERINSTLAKTDDKIRADGLASTRTDKSQYRNALTPTKLKPSSLSLAPGTTNPPAAALVFNPANEKRDVAERLRRFAAVEGVILAESFDGASPPAAPQPTPNARQINLKQAFEIAQRTGRELLNAEDEYVMATIRLLVERHLWGPRLFNDTTVGLAGTGTGGNFEHALDIINSLRVTQRLPYGGEVEAAWIVRAADQLREQTTGGYRQSSSIVLSGSIPLLRGAGDIAREDLIQSERNLIYQARSFERFRRQHLVSLAADYFSILQTRSTITNQQRQLYSLRSLEKSTAAKVDAGRLEAFELGIASNRVQGALSDLSSLVDRHIFELERFKIRLGLSVDEAITITEDIIDLPDPEADMVQAANLALEFRLDLQNDRDRLDDARRTVSNARNLLLPDLRLAGTIGIPTPVDDPTGGLAISADDLNYGATATLSLPLDRENERLNLRSQMVMLQRLTRDYEQARDNIIVAVRDTLRGVDNARIQLIIAEKQVEINRERVRGNKLRIDTINTQTIVDSENDLLASENQRDGARTALRNAVLNYLLASDQLRVGRDGSFVPLPGMTP